MIREIIGLRSLEKKCGPLKKRLLSLKKWLENPKNVCEATVNSVECRKKVWIYWQKLIKLIKPVKKRILIHSRSAGLINILLLNYYIIIKAQFWGGKYR